MATERDTEEEEYTITAQEIFRLQDEYWSKVRESEGFDIEDVKIPPFCPAMSCYDSRRPGSIPLRMLVKGYATIGLHRYNMLQGTRFQVHGLLKVHMTPNAVSSHYITLAGYDPDTREHKTFQVRIDEESYGTLDMTVSVTRVKDEVTTINKPFVPHFHGGAEADDDHFRGELPDWPSDDAFNDTNRFYLVKESEWQTSDWIIPCLELAVVANNRDILFMLDQDSILPKLQILKVVIETSEDHVDEKLEAKSAHVYITFKGLEKDRRSVKVGEDVQRQAIVRRVLDESTGYLSLRGKLWNGKTTSKRSKKKRARLL